MVQNGLGWCEIVRHGATCCGIVRNGVGLCRFMRNYGECCSASAGYRVMVLDDEEGMLKGEK